MRDFYFPKEVWQIIKSFEYAMTYSVNDQEQAIDYMKYHISMPYALGLHDEKPHYKQYAALQTMRSELWDIFNDCTIRELIHRFGKQYHDSFGGVCTYH